jgi:hypothetical protein
MLRAYTVISAESKAGLTNATYILSANLVYIKDRRT